MRQTGLPTQPVERMLEAYVSDAAAAIRGTEVNVEQRTQEWKEESRRQVRETFGNQGWDVEDLARRAEAFVAKHPRVREVLGTNGLLWKPEIYMSLIEHVRKLR
jgi:hypothetical protein